MKRLGTIAVGLAAGLAGNAGLCAPAAASRTPPAHRPAAIAALAPAESAVAVTDTASSDEPYAMIATRNIFGLQPPPPPPPPPVEDPAKNLPKITPQGIMGFLGSYQVLFKVAPAKAAPNVKDTYYTLHEGEMQDEIEVKKIDNANSLVTFINHGIEQDLLLVKASPSGGGAPAGGAPAAGGVPMPARTDQAGGIANNSTVVNFGGAGRGGLGVRTAGGPGYTGGGGPGANGGLNFGASTQGRVYQPQPPTMSPDASTIAIEANRAALMNDPHPPYSPNLLPTTPLTELNTPGGK